tara:strand:- start:305 stop:1498 length:1194 start_codon:yes stop_codon:yes gene_type:complete
MEKNKFNYDVCVIGGLGHVGLPLSIVFADKGLNVCSYDIDKNSINNVKKGKMPFIEYGAEDLLTKNINNKKLYFTSDPKYISESKYIMICIGTPIDEYLNPKTHEFLKSLTEIKNYLESNQTIIIRSSVFPRTCKQILDLLGNEKKWNLAYCPERIVQGYAIKELKNLPQIISGFSENAVSEATKLFQIITKKIIHTTVEQAELTKLFSNAWRYIKFGIANEFYMIANDYGEDYEEIREIMQRDYQRVQGLPKAGFTAGPCLLKDTMQLSTFYDNRFLLGQAAMNINEGLPNYIVGYIKKNNKLKNKKIGILGMAFKANVDDIRGSLSYKLRKILFFEGAKVFCSDPFVQDSSFLTAKELIKKCDIIIIGAPHSIYSSLSLDNKVVIDIWNTINFKA